MTQLHLDQLTCPDLPSLHQLYLPAYSTHPCTTMPGPAKKVKKAQPAVEPQYPPRPTPDEGASSDTSTSSTVVLMNLEDEDVSILVPPPTRQAQEEAQEPQEVPQQPAGAEAQQKAEAQRRKQIILSDEVERRLGEWLEFEASFIYNKKDSRHVNKPLVTKTWEDKAKTLDPPLTSEELQRWFQSVRTKFGKLTGGPKSGSGAQNLTSREKWVLNTFTFLKPHISRQRKTTSYGLPPVSIKIYLFIYCALSIVFTHCSQ